MLKPLLVLALLSFATPAAAQDSHAALAEARRHVSAPALVERYGPDDLRRGELRLPKGKGPFPVAVVIHGGCWSAAMENWTGTAPLADALTRRGIATWNIEYRRTGNAGGGYPGTFEDIAAAVEHVAVLARTQPLDLHHVALVGHNSGAHLALWAASRAKLAGPLGRGKVRIETVVAIDGPGTLAPFIGVDAQVCGAPAIVPFIGGTPAEKSEAYALASPMDRLPLGVRQLLVEGALGPMMQPYYAAANQSGDEVVRFSPGGADHFNIITPGTPHGKEVADFIASHAFTD
jgi:acetyl esterase/lipase